MSTKVQPSISSPAPLASALPAAAGAGFAELIRKFSTDGSSAVASIRAGFPASLLKDAGAYFDVPAQRIRNIARLPETTAHTLVKRGALMDAAASERLWRLADLMNLAQEVFDDEAAAKAWLRTPNLTFHDDAPMDYLDTEPGAIAVRQVLNAIATGGAL